MRLRALTFAVDPAVWTTAAGAADRSADPTLASLPCAFCGIRSGQWQTTCDADGEIASTGLARPMPACPLCALPRHLERPRIDDEAALIWVPEMSQQAINAVVRQTHMRARALDESLRTGDGFRNNSPERRALYCAQAVLLERAGRAATRLGTNSPRDLGIALLHLSPAAYARRVALLGGLRILPLGRVFEGGQDVYPNIVDTWLELSKSPARRAPAAGTRVASPQG